ncbi:lipocalin-like domain-containing protein [Pseudooceanicola onchidii]|uniref:lipocalin-like domain-containing protein n=1 Tax=Pseudooceanicola onchidii TaxID=2562279 RepID=UPI0010AA36A7|nr:lipocalin-like domain-containing protein [Pseudooceanicola onchidii]
MSDEIYGNWRLEAVRYVFSDTGEEFLPFGDDPLGFITITRDNRLSTVITARDRSPHPGETPEAAMIRTMFSYSGALTIRDGQFTALVDVAWVPAYVGTEQIRNFTITDDRLVIATSETTFPAFPGRLGVAYLDWVRVAVA